MVYMYYIYIFYKARTLAVVSNCLQNTEVEPSIKIVIHKTKIE